jgi:hypothetical protein
MSQIITNNFKIYNAEKFISNSADDNLYLSIGRPQQWATEAAPDVPLNTLYQDVIYSSDSVALKRIVQSDIKQVVKRYDWNSGVVYSQYDDANENLLNSNFYVLTYPDYNVYKCISNNNGAQSLTKPSGRSTSIFTTADGYKWKFMYYLTDTDLLKFLTNEYMAVNTYDDVVATAIPGTVDNFVIENQGNTVTAFSGTVTGNGTGATISTTVVGNKLTNIAVVNSGSNYTYANALTGGNSVVRPIISPLKGHGYNSYEELGGYYIMINTRLDYAEGAGDFPILNDYRRLTILQNPVSNATGTIATELTLDATYTIKLSTGTGTFSLDEDIIGSVSGKSAKIVTANVYQGNTTLRCIIPYNYISSGTIFDSGENFVLGETVTGKTSSATGTFIKTTLPEVVKNTGKVLYVENRKKITRNYDQAENIHMVIEF